MFCGGHHQLARRSSPSSSGLIINSVSNRGQIGCVNQQSSFTRGVTESAGLVAAVGGWRGVGVIRTRRSVWTRCGWASPQPRSGANAERDCVRRTSRSGCAGSEASELSKRVVVFGRAAAGLRNSRAPGECGARLCPQYQSQRVRHGEASESSRRVDVFEIRCGWASPQPRSAQMRSATVSAGPVAAGSLAVRVRSYPEASIG